MKDYKDWMKVKARVNNRPKRVRYHVGSIYWMNLGENVGYEQDGKGGDFVRPVLVVCAISKELFWGVPLTSREKVGRHYFRLEQKIRGVTNTAILSQMKPCDALRITNWRPLGKIRRAELVELKSRLRAYLK